MTGDSENIEGNRRQYSEEFKKDAVGHSLTSEKTVAEVAQDLGIAHSNLKEMESQISQQRGFIQEHADRLKCHEDVPGAKGFPVWALSVGQRS